MTTTLAPTREHRFYAAALPKGAKWPVERLSDDTGIVRGIEVFKTGTFKDSMGEQNTWEDIHLQQMVANFELLSQNGIFTDPPMRVGHWSGANGLCGYITNVYINEAGRLAVDVHITEPNDVDKIERGTYRFVSSEIGMYETNDGSMYWPTVFGVAFVDVPAIEGLHGKQTEGVHCFSRVDQSSSEDTTVAENQTENKDEMVAPSTHANANAGAPVVAPPAPAQSYSLFGRPTTDPVAVQAHIDGLEATVKAADEKQREDFVKDLETRKVISAKQTDGLTQFAKDLTAAQYDAWKATYADAPQMSLLSEHGRTNPVTPEQTTTPRDEEIETLKGIIEYSKRSGAWTDEKLKTHPAQLRLNALLAQN